VGGCVRPNAYVFLQGGWVGVAKRLHNYKNQGKGDFLKNTRNIKAFLLKEANRQLILIKRQQWLLNSESNYRSKVKKFK
jgi:hypothetical protein